MTPRSSLSAVTTGGFLARAVLGSVGQDVLSQSSVPVCVAPNIALSAALPS